MKAGFLLGLFILIFGFTSVRKSKIPPGTVKITDRLFFDQCEISNFSWREFEYSISLQYGKGSPEHLAVMPDPNVWMKGAIKRPVKVLEYYTQPQYRDYPVVGISYEQALAFCKWRTSMVKMFFAKVYHTEFKMEYRLPTQEEWELVAYWESGKISDFDKAKPESCHLLADTFSTGPVPVNSFPKGIFGMHHLIGNVAEMTMEKNKSKGGSWQHKSDEARIGKVQVYEEPNKWLGFRCVCVFKQADV